MKPEAQRIAIAEACGWKSRHGTELRGPCGTDNFEWTEWTSPQGQVFGDLPDYLNDLNAMHDAESNLMNDQRREFASLLVAVHPLHYSPYEEDADDRHMKVFLLAHCTASQRAESFLRTLNLWKD